jgi:peptidoglycan-associated lipoprotein
MTKRTLRQWPIVCVTTLLLGGMAMAGCTKRPAPATGTTGWTAPAPADATGSVRDRTVLTARPSGAASGQPGGASVQPGRRDDLAEPRRADGRPRPHGFSAAADLVDVYFEFDRYDIQPAQARVLESNARWLRANQDLVLIEGHCDERGTSEYNLALGERRAASAMNYLVAHGITPSRITIVSYGKERPQCTESNEDCWQKNRRAHFAPGQ